MKAMLKKEIKFTINGTENARKCGLFDKIYSISGPQSGIELTSLSVDEIGGLNLLCFMPDISNTEIDNFLNKPLHIYRNALPNGVISTSLRGMTSMDFIHLPYSSPIDLRDVSPKNQLVNSFLVDTSTDKIKGIRLIGLSEETVRQLLDDWISTEDAGFDKNDIYETLNKYVFPYSSEDFQKMSTYIGTNISAFTAKNLNTLPM
ncbi:MAG: hypothetical protein IKJ91_03355 [Clostridia bacterium]|nr:hypothetical protein [Clostridia bacterium]